VTILGDLRAQAPSKKPDEEFTPVERQQAQTDRRDFFHGEGRALAYNPGKPAPGKRYGPGSHYELGTELELKVEDIHFGNPRVRIMQGEPAPMPQMLKWPSVKYDEFVLDCAEIDFGEYRVWCAIGIRSNRLLYAMKRLGVVHLKAVVVAAPPPVEEDDVDLTYGASIQIIQLVP
jgi:hypothetical protein